jgi:hypothetical protein
VVVSKVRRRGSGLIVLAVLALVAMPGLRPIDALAAPVTITTAYTTGYTWFDNSPPGADICCGVIHAKAGGTGTYADPITIAAGLVSGNVLDYPAGTRFYMPDVRRYFIVEDSCGSVGSGCHVLTAAPPGATTWLDRWVGGTASDSQSAVQGCANYLTDEDGASPLHTLIENPPAGLAVVPGPLFQNGHCTAVYGNGVSQPPAPAPAPPTQAPAPPPTAAPTAAPTEAPTAIPTALPTATPVSSTPRRTAVPVAAKTNPLVNYVRGLLPTATIALLLAVGATGFWLLWRRRSRNRA